MTDEARQSGTDRIERLRRIFSAASECPPRDRQRFLEQACVGDDDLRGELERYLSADAEKGGPLDMAVDVLMEGWGEEGSEDDAVEAMASCESLFGTPSVGTEIGPYRLVEIIGEGGMGTVYRARQSSPVQREVALKVIKPGMDTREVVARFESERQALAVMSHSGIARVLDAGATDAGRPFFVMELVRGMPLDEYCDTHKLTTAQRLDLFAKVCDAVHHAHQKGVIHRDLKPSNVLVAVEDSKPIPKIIDFGIAKAVGSSLIQGTLVTTMGQMLGTPAYMSPEQAERSGLDVDTTTDVYSLGVIMYELLSGSLPFDSETLRKPDLIVQWLLREKAIQTPSARLSSLLETQQTVARNRRTDVRTLQRELRGDLDWVVMKAMDKDRTRRYSAASELAADVRRFVSGEPVSARPPSNVYRFRKFARRNRGALAAGVTLALALSGGATASSVGFLRAERSAAQANEAAARAEAVTDFMDRMLGASNPVSGSDSETTVREVLDAASAEIEAGAFAGRPLVEASVRRTIGEAYASLGLRSRAVEHLEAAMALVDLTPDATSLDRVRMLRSLANVRTASEAEGLYRQALSLADSAGLTTDGGDGEREVNRTLNSLGLDLWELDRVEEAGEVLGALSASQRRSPVSPRIDQASTLNNLALVKRAQGDVDEAIRLFEESLELLREAVGGRHVYVAAVLESIGSLEQLRGDYATADRLMRQALEMRRDILGGSHADVVNSLNGLGLLHMEMGDLDAAESYFDEALAMSLEVNGEMDKLTASVLNNLGLLQLRRGNAAEAESTLQRAIAIRQEVLGDRHRNTLNSSANLAAAWSSLGRHGDAEGLARSVVETERSIGVVSAVRLGSALRTWGRALTGLGRFEEAEGPLIEAYEMQERELGLDHLHTQRTVQALAELYQAWGREEQAVEWTSRTTEP